MKPLCIAANRSSLCHRRWQEETHSIQQRVANYEAPKCKWNPQMPCPWLKVPGISGQLPELLQFRYHRFSVLCIAGKRDEFQRALASPAQPPKSEWDCDQPPSGPDDQNSKCSSPKKGMGLTAVCDESRKNLGCVEANQKDVIYYI